MGLLSGSHQLEVLATPEQCFEVVTDFEAYPEWWSEVKETEILKVGKNELAETVEYLADATVRKVSYQLNYKYKRPELMTWTYGGGDIKDFFGSFKLEQTDSGSTFITYELSADPGFWTPPGLAKKIHEHALKRGLESLKKRVESLF